MEFTFHGISWDLMGKKTHKKIYEENKIEPIVDEWTGATSADDVCALCRLLSETKLAPIQIKCIYTLQTNSVARDT